MVTLILMFIFVAPRFIDFRDEPTKRVPPPTGIIVYSDGQDGLIYQVDASSVKATSGEALDQELLHALEPVSGEIKILNVRPVTNEKGKTTHYLVRAAR